MRINNDLNETVGCNIKAWRTIKGFKQEWLAAKINLSKSSLSQIENGKTEITISRLSEIADVLEIHLFDLFGNPHERLTHTVHTHQLNY
ncbi:helix-turn-helix domain-containing protein [Terrimonas pollutisoli]|uniref:helix-turn-helix domain-containing protein n=1 Tax=Terrimonas pollutisoli TaxID=3034147 RepID=UPI0023EB9271|nr:helix-turn-helix transcriptional regulator [Terrimonas sp. H1YJ31]